MRRRTSPSVLQWRRRPRPFRAALLGTMRIPARARQTSATGALLLALPRTDVALRVKGPASSRAGSFAWRCGGLNGAVHLDFARRPNAAAYLPLAFMARRGRRSPFTIPEITARWRGLRPVDVLPPAVPVAAAPRGTEGVHPVYLHAASLRLMMAMLTRPSFPIPIWSVLQVQNRIVQHRASSLGEPLDVDARVDAWRPVAKGIGVDVRVRIESPVAPVLDSVTTFYARGKFGAAEAEASRLAAPEPRSASGKSGPFPRLGPGASGGSPATTTGSTGRRATRGHSGSRGLSAIRIERLPRSWTGCRGSTWPDRSGSTPGSRVRSTTRIPSSSRQSPTRKGRCSRSDFGARRAPQSWASSFPCSGRGAG